MKIALIQAPAFGIDRPPLALGYLSAFLRRDGYEVNIFDLNIDLYAKATQKNRKFWEFQYVFNWLDNDYFCKEEILSKEHFKNWARQILDSGSDVVGFSIQSSSLAASINLAKEIKSLAPDKLIVFGGPLNLSYSIEHAYYLLQLENLSKNKVIDIVVLGEGEETLIDILRKVENKDSLRGCAGTVIMQDGQIIENQPRPLIENLNSIPFPDFDDFPKSYKYKNRLPILSSRGCVHRCTFCDDTLMWGQYRYRSAENIMEEIRLRKEQKAEFLEFNDLLINGNLNQLSQLCDLLIKEKLDTPWGGSACIDSRMDLNFLRKLKDAGCCYLNYGIESASPKILKDMHKNFTIEEAKRVIDNTYKAGIAVCTNWIVGFPTENEENFNQTLDFIRSNYKYLRNNIMVNSFILKGNSVLFNEQERFGIVSDENRNWNSQGGLNTKEKRRKRFDEFLELIALLKDEPAHKTFQG